MSRKVTLLLALLLIANLVVGIISFNRNTSTATDEADGAVGLERPWFIDEAFASDERTARAIADISAEAGMSAYVKSASAINLTNARKAFTRGVEEQTADYIIGLVPITGYDASWDAHVLVHRTGWILAYYPNTWITAKALNEKHQTIGGSTKLSLAIDAVGSKIAQSFPTKSYYNFAHPSATKMLVIHFKNGQDPRLKLPGSFTYYEKSLMIYGGTYGDFYIESTHIADRYWDFGYYDISSALTENTYVQTYSSSDSWGMIVILYS
jgi:hypothetical protein